MNKIRIVSVAALIFLAIGMISLIGWATYTLAVIPTNGTFTPTYGVTLSPTTINWGDATLNTPISKTVLITNTGSKTIGSLTMSATNLVGIGSTDFTLTWNLEGQQLDIGVTKTATFTFTLTAPVSSTWRFDLQVKDATG